MVILPNLQLVVVMEQAELMVLLALQVFQLQMQLVVLLAPVGLMVLLVFQVPLQQVR